MMILDDPTYIPMPSPNSNSYDYSSNAYNTSAYNNNAYETNANNANVNAYEHSQAEYDDNAKNEYDSNTAELDESASAANPGIETHDPDKLKISSQMVENTSNVPNKWRLLSRFIQFLASAGAFAFIVSTATHPVSEYF